MTVLTRREKIQNLFPDQPAYRLRQMEAAVFHDGWKSWKDVSELPQAVRETLEKELPWTSWSAADLHKSAAGDSFKVVLALPDGNRIETVLMKNHRGQWTVCVSSQVGCAMKCAFCATGALGLFRNLNADEIVDQVRFWRDFLLKKESGGGAGAQRRGETESSSCVTSEPSRNAEASGDRPNLQTSKPQNLKTSAPPPNRISNVVFMGMGEPMANYETIKEAIRTILKHTDIGPTRIIISTSGMLPQLEALLDDKDWPDVRLAISLHSADSKIRQALMPSSYDAFLDRLRTWALRYLALKGDRRHYLTFEYVMLGGVNDAPADASKLAAFVRTIGNVKVNLIPYNRTDAGFKPVAEDVFQGFFDYLEREGVTVTRRKSLGEDIDAACGQLAAK